MGQGPLYRVPFRRRREGKTDYRSRLALLKGEKPRLVVRRSNRNVTAQFVTYDETGDKVVAQAQATELKEMGWNGYTSNVPAAYLTGLLAAKRFRDTNPEADDDGNHAVLDIGRAQPHQGGRYFAALAGALEAGLKIPHGAAVIPIDDRLRGEHIDAETAAAFAAAYEKIAGKPLGPKKAAPKKKPAEKAKGAPAPGAPKPKSASAPTPTPAPAKREKKDEGSGWMKGKTSKKDKKAKTPE